MLVQTGPAHAYFPCEPSSKKKETGGSKAEKGDQRKLQHILERQVREGGKEGGREEGKMEEDHLRPAQFCSQEDWILPL
jgi:hypothetical protein